MHLVHSSTPHPQSLFFTLYLWHLVLVLVDAFAHPWLFHQLYPCYIKIPLLFNFIELKISWNLLLHLGHKPSLFLHQHQSPFMRFSWMVDPRLEEHHHPLQYPSPQNQLQIRTSPPRPKHLQLFQMDVWWICQLAAMSSLYSSFPNHLSTWLLIMVLD